MPSDVRRAALIGFTLAALLMALSWATTEDPPPDADGKFSFAEVFQQPRTRAEVMVNRRDGPAAAQLATDLTLSDPAGFHDYYAGSDPDEELAYRAARPVLPVLTWMLSLGGRRSLLAPALMVLTVASLGAAAASSAMLARSLGRQTTLAGLIVILPGLAISTWAPGGVEPLAVSLTLAAWASAVVGGHARIQVALFTLAVLTRESSVIVPLALAATMTQWTWRRRLATAAVPVVVYASWALVIAARTGHLPGNAGGGRAAPFFTGFAESAPAWPPLGWVMLALVVLLGAAAWQLALPGAREAIVLHILLASMLGHLVWDQPLDFSRVFTVVEVMGMIALLPAMPQRAAGAPMLAGP